MLTVTKIFTFCAAHKLPDHAGQCKNLHGHTYTLEVELIGHLERNGMICDFGEMSDRVKEIVDKVDHTYLNETISQPTAEQITIWFRDQLSQIYPSKLSRIRLYESPTSYAEWKKGDR